MNDIERLVAIEAIKTVKARYLRGVDTGDTEGVKAILAEDCELDFRGCCTDPASGRDFLPSMNIVLNGNAGWRSALGESGIRSTHHCHNVEINFASDVEASATWSMTDRLFMPAGSGFSVMTGYGYYHDTYQKTDGAWKIKTMRIERILVEAA